MVNKNNEKSAAAGKKNVWNNVNKSDNSRTNYNLNELTKNFKTERIQKYLNLWNPDNMNKLKKSGYVYGLPGFKGDVKFKVNFIKPDKRICDKFNIILTGKNKILPIAKLVKYDNKVLENMKEMIALKIDEPDFPVLLYDPERNSTVMIAKTFEDFFNKMIEKNEILPSALAEIYLKKAMLLYYKNDIEEALKNLKIIDSMDKDDGSFAGNESLIVISCKYLGLIFKKNGNRKDALKYFELSFETGLKINFYDGFFYIIEMLEESGNYRESIERIFKFREAVKDRNVDDETFFLRCLHSGLAHIHTGEEKSALKEFDRIISHFSDWDIEKIFRSINSVYELVSSGCSTALSKKILNRLNNSINFHILKKQNGILSS